MITQSTFPKTREHRGKLFPVSEAHPEADAFPWLDEDEIAALAADIKRTGQREAIRALPDGRIVDGRNRELACRIAGVQPHYQTVRLSESEIPTYVASLNEHRRHLSPEWRRERVQAKRAEGKSTRQIANEMGIHQTQVARDLNTVCSPATVTGRDGKTYPSRQANVLESGQSVKVEPLPPNPTQIAREAIAVLMRDSDADGPARKAIGTAASYYGLSAATVMAVLNGAVAILDGRLPPVAAPSSPWERAA